MPIEAVDRAILTVLEQEVLQPAIITKALERALHQLQADREEPADQREVLLQELRGLETELARFTQAIAAGGSLPTIMSAIREREARREILTRELACLDGTPIDRFDASQVEQELRGYLSDWGTLANRNPAIARQVLRKLFPSRIKLSREADGTYWFSGTGALGRMLNGLVGFHRGKGQGKMLGAPDRT